MATLTLKKHEKLELAGPEGLIDIAVTTGGERYVFSFSADQIRGTIPASKRNAKEFRAALLPALETVFGRVR